MIHYFPNFVKIPLTYLLVWIIAISGMMLTACEDDLADSLRQYNFALQVLDSDNTPLAVFDSATVTFTNLSSGTTVMFDYPLDDKSTITAGIYDVSFEGNRGIFEYRAVSRSVEIMSNNNLIRLHAFTNRLSDDLIIAEIFFTGTLQSSGNQYYGDNYVKLYNNTGHVIYADGITLFESKFLTTEKRDYIPDRMSEGVAVQAMYTIPGSGREHPVKPGEFILLADTGIDHRQINPNSFDLSHADWEWYDESSVPSQLDIDSPLVGNLDKWYSYTKSFFLLHNRGFRAIGIARIQDSKEKFLERNWYEYEYETVTQAGTFPMTGNAYIIPNKDIVDVVNCSTASNWQWNVTAPSLDMGWTHCGTGSDDKSRYFHSVRRKLLYITDNGRAVFKDTDNSSDDFNPMVTPSEIEIQGTATGIDNSVKAMITYDGITPIEK